MAPVISIVGSSGVGKTTLIEKLISVFVAKGYRVAAVKHASHDFDIDHEGKDTWRYAGAGAHEVLISSPHKIAMIKQRSKETGLGRLCDLYLDSADIIIAEGFKREGLPKIEVLRKTVQEEPLCRKKDRLIALASDTPINMDLPVFDINDAESVCEFIIKHVIKKKRKVFGVLLRINDQKIPMNRFVRDMFKEVVMAMVSTLRLKRISKPVRVELSIDTREPGDVKEDR
jgi:molybdopterin-guanine dinucleotide biosynthesis protein MobB